MENDTVRQPSGPLRRGRRGRLGRDFGRRLGGRSLVLGFMLGLDDRARQGIDVDFLTEPAYELVSALPTPQEAVAA